MGDHFLIFHGNSGLYLKNLVKCNETYRREDDPLHAAIIAASLEREIIMEQTVIQSPLGPLTLFSENQCLIALVFGRYGSYDDTPLFRKAKRQLNEYFSGQRQTFSLPLHPEGTAFQRRVWLALQGIPYGTAISYRELAARVGSPRGFQAVGQANGHNPLPILSPCHRVIAADGSLGGYASGLDRKRFLLDLEGVPVKETVSGWGIEHLSAE